MVVTYTQENNTATEVLHSDVYCRDVQVERTHLLKLAKGPSETQLTVQGLLERSKSSMSRLRALTWKIRLQSLTLLPINYKEYLCWDD